MEPGIGLHGLAGPDTINIVWRLVVEITLEYRLGAVCFRVEWIGIGEFDLGIYFGWRHGDRVLCKH